MLCFISPRQRGWGFMKTFVFRRSQGGGDGGGKKNEKFPAMS